MKPTLYLMVGLPGSGKSVTSHTIAELTGATLLWTAKIRVEHYGKNPTYSDQENKELYGHINEMVKDLLVASNSVVFDTSFNYFKDREYLREIAKNHGAETVVVWVQTARETSKNRATQDAEQQAYRLLGDMTENDFDRLSDSLEQPKPSENAVLMDGTKITKDYVKQQLESIQKNA
jgi:predicted kinase